jgi:hypothetical protein
MIISFKLGSNNTNYIEKNFKVFFFFKSQLDVSPEELIELKKNTTLNLDYIPSKSFMNNPCWTMTNDSIDISMQLSDNFGTTSDENDVLLTFYNQPIINNSECSRI